MCEIQIVYKIGKGNLNKNEIENFADMMRLGHTYNSNAHGVFSPRGIIFKSNTETLSEDAIIRAVGKNKPKFLVGHNRNATKGSAEKMDNNHPFETEHFIWCHNGGISNHDVIKDLLDYRGNVETDSYAIGLAMEDKYSKGFTDLIKDVIVPSIEELSGGYSVVVYAKTEDRLFYFKNKTTRFMFGLVENEDGTSTLFGATDYRNIELQYQVTKLGFFKKMNKDVLMREPKEEVLYELTDTAIRSVGIFKEEAKARHFTYTKSLTKADNSSEDVWLSGSIVKVNNSNFQTKLLNTDYTHKKFYRILAHTIITKARLFLKEANYDIEFTNREYNKQNKSIVLEYKGVVDVDNELVAVFPQDVAQELTEYFSEIGEMEFPTPTGRMVDGIHTFYGELVFMIKNMSAEAFEDIKGELAECVNELGRNNVTREETTDIGEVVCIGSKDLEKLDMETMTAIGDDLLVDEVTGVKYQVTAGALVEYYNKYYGMINKAE